MAKYKKTEIDQYQMVVLDFGELFDDHHPTTMLLRIIQGMDLSEFDKSYNNDHCGTSAFPPDRILALIVWNRLYGGRSMRSLERDLTKRADLMYLSGGLEVDHSSFSRFRSRHAAAIERIFDQTVFLGAASGQILWDCVCTDSTKIKACANRDEMYTEEKLGRLKSHVEDFCQELYQRIEASEDEAERICAEELVEKKVRSMEKIAQAKAYLERHPDRKWVHLNEPDATCLKDKQLGFIPGYSVQVSTDIHSQMIVAKEVTTCANDTGWAEAMVEKVETIKKKPPTGKTKKRNTSLIAAMQAKKPLLPCVRTISICRISKWLQNAILI